MGRRQRREWIDAWPQVAEGWRHWARLDDAERARVGELAEWVLRRKRFEAAKGFELAPEVTTTIALNAGLLVLGLGQAPLRDVTTIIVHRGTITQRGTWSTSLRGVVRSGTRRVIGHALDRRGPVVLSWPAVRADMTHDRGQNVVLHELAHKLDAVDGLFDGTPEIDDRSDHARWVRVCTREYRRLRRRGADHVLRAYATTNPSEFFAVVTEAFFERPTELEESRPELYDVFRSFYGQDPSRRVARTG